MHGRPSRRSVLGGLAGAAGTLISAGFGARAAMAAVSCPNACRSMIGPDDAWIRGLPIIDAHCHIFNARDIPAVHFITRVLLPHYAILLSPEKRQRLERDIAKAMGEKLSETPGYAQERALLEARLAGEPGTAPSEAAALPRFARGTDKSCFGSDVAHNIGAVRNLVSILKRSRHGNFEALMATFRSPLKGVGVALYTPAMVDMDYWLGADREPSQAVDDTGTDAFSLPQASVAEQIELMELIQRLHPGRCHGFVSFCPWREVDDRHAGRQPSALDLVKDAVLNRGFVGVKLYPPMGFLPFGNAALPLDHFPPLAAREPYAATFPSDLDAALLALYRLCAENDVPIMAHCAPSNSAGFTETSDGERASYAERAHPDGWAAALRQPGLAGLRVNLAHFGVGADPAKTAQWQAAIGRLMDAHPHVYADLSHYPDMLLDNFIGTGQHCREAAEILEPLRREFLAAGRHRAGRLLYGSDWSMLAKEFYYADYLAVVAHMYRRKIYGVGRGAERNAQALLSGNAVRFLGLRQGDATRSRLETWYARHGLDAKVLQRFDSGGG